MAGLGFVALLFSCICIGCCASKPTGQTDTCADTAASTVSPAPEAPPDAHEEALPRVSRSNGMNSCFPDLAMLPKRSIAQGSNYLSVGRWELRQVLEGRIDVFPQFEASSEYKDMLVESVMNINIWQAKSYRATLKTELENTYWKLIQLRDQPVVTDTDRSEVHIRLVPEGRRVQGFAGCNRLLSRYELDGNRIRFRGLATTRMVCVGGMEQEQAFLKALEMVERWNIIGEHLELSSADGELLARFEARSSK